MLDHSIRWVAAGLMALTCGGCGASEELGSSNGALTDEEGSVDAGAPDAAAVDDVSAVLAKLAHCKQISEGTFRNSSSAGAVAICGLGDAVYWTSDMDVDCDGRRSDACSRSTDPDFQSQTAGTDSHGQPLDAAKLPYVVIPGVSSRFNYREHGIKMGTVAMAIYKGKSAFGVVGDVGPQALVGEASVAMAKALDIPASPTKGGVESGVTYILFTGDAGRVKKLEDHDEAVRIGRERLAALMK